MAKRGRLSVTEVNQMRELVKQGKTVEEVAVELNRSVQTVTKVVTETVKDVNG